MRYRLTHTTKYAYTEAVPLCHNKLHLAPRPIDWQSCKDYRLLILPEPALIEQREDYFGNRVDYFSITDAHRGLSVTATSTIETRAREAAEATPSKIAWEDVVAKLRTATDGASLDNRLFTFKSDLASVGEAYAAYARPSFASGRCPLEATLDLTRRIHEDFEYDPRATNVSTPTEQVLRQRAGVCQDFAHLQIACLRSLGMAARYVSGYLRTLPPPGKPRLVGADASHAWVSVYCGELGWIDFDPTNDVIPSTDHITVAYGRDYADVCPIQGVFIGGGDHTMTVSVDVLAVDG